MVSDAGYLRQLTHGSILDYRPVVATDGQKIAYFTNGDQGQHELAMISWPEAAPLRLKLRQAFKWVHGPWWAADSRHLLVHGLTKGGARPALWHLDTAEGTCARLHLPGVADSSHGTWDKAQSWLAFDSRQDWGLPAPAVPTFSSV